MNKNLVTFLTILLCLVLVASAAYAQEIKPRVRTENVIRLYQEELLSEVDIDTYLQSGEIKLLGGLELVPPKAIPGPAPDPYPHVHMWEAGIEQLGHSSETCDGIYFVNGPVWHPKKYALILWKVIIPNAGERLPTEFERDLTLSMWVDWNQDQSWGKNEKMINLSFNIQEYMPGSIGDLEIQYLTKFRIPQASTVDAMLPGGGKKQDAAKLWARGMVSYDDPDTSPDGECLFGEVEDWQVHYFEIQAGKWIKK
jgi:hypothetical protein